MIANVTGDMVVRSPLVTVVQRNGLVRRKHVAR